MEYEKYLIKKGKCDLLSSLKALDKKIVKEMMKKNRVNTLQELKEEIINEFEFCLSMSKDDSFTQIYFQRILDNENSAYMSIYKQDVEALWAFVYENNGHYSYYIATEIKKIIKKELDLE